MVRNKLPRSSRKSNPEEAGYNTYSSVYGGTYGAAQNSTYGGNNKPPPTYDSQPPSYGNEAQAYGIKNNVNSNQNAYNQSQVRNAQASGTITGHRTNGSKNERAKLEERVKREAEIILQARRSALNSALDTMEALDAGQRKLKVGLNTLKEQENTLKGYIQVTKSKNANIAQWLVENENKNKKDVDPDEVISSGDVWSEQIFDQVATISAIDDTLFELDEGLKRGVVDLKPFLRSVRNLASQQFRAKALAMKICDLQSQMMLARHSSRKSSGGHFGGKTNSGGMFSLTMDKMRILAISEVSTCTASYECSTCSVSKMLNSNINKYADQSKTVELQRSQKQQGYCFLNERRFNYCAIPQTRFVLACINNYKEKKEEGDRKPVCVCVFFYYRLLQNI